MQQVSILYGWYERDAKPTREYYDLERKLFADRYVVCSRSYEYFKTRFRMRYLCGSCYDRKNLCGLLFIDELVKDLLYYLRVIGVSQAYTGKGIAHKLICGALDELPRYHQLAFVTESSKLLLILSKHYNPVNDFCSADLSTVLAQYNNKLAEKSPNHWISGYYQLIDSTYAPGFFGLVERPRSSGDVCPKNYRK